MVNKKFRFIHASDIHLGSFLHINEIDFESINDLSKNGVYDVFERLCNNVIENKCDFILICGDIYDSQYRSIKANNFFVNQCNRLKENNINMYAIYGNHDPLSKMEILNLPSNVFICSGDNVDIFEFEKNEVLMAKIMGKSYTKKHESKKFHEDYEVLNEDVFNIAMLHTALEPNNKNYIPCSIEELKERKDIDYWALGHIHKQQILNSENPTILYPGIPQGRDMGEENVGGCFIVDVNGKTIENIEFVPLSTVIYKTVEIFIDSDKENTPGNITELENLIISKSRTVIDEDIHELYTNKYIKVINKKDIKGYVIKWVIKGFTELHNFLSNMNEEDINSIIENINNELLYDENFILTDSIVIRTNPCLQEYEMLKMEHVLFKELDEITQLCYEDNKFKNCILDNWGKVWKKNNVDNLDEDKFCVDDETFEKIIGQAKNLIIEELVKFL